MNELKKIIKKLKKLRTDEKLKISDEIMFDGGLRVYISNRISNEKNPKKTEYATATQQTKMAELNIPIPKNLTRDMADKILFKYIK